MKISNRYAIVTNNNECIGLLPIRNNNDEIRKYIDITKKMKFLNNGFIESEPQLKQSTVSLKKEKIQDSTQETLFLGDENDEP